MTPIEKAIEALARCTPYMYKYSPVEAYAAHCTLVDALRAQPNIKNYLEKDISQPDHSELVKREES